MFIKDVVCLCAKFHPNPFKVALRERVTNIVASILTTFHIYNISRICGT